MTEGTFPDWFSHARPSFERHLTGADGEALQLGVFTGDASDWLMRHTRMHLTDVDPWSDGEGSEPYLADLGLDMKGVERAYNERMYGRHEDGRLTVWKATSARYLADSPNQGTEPPCGFDFVYIDGDHRARAALADAVGAWTHLRPGGLLAFDDYEWSSISGRPEDEPKMAIDAFVACYADELEMVERGYQLWVRKR